MVSSKIEREYDNFPYKVALKKAEEMLIKSRNMVPIDEKASIYDDPQYGEIIIKNYGFSPNGDVELRISPAGYTISNIAVYGVNLKTNTITDYFD